MGHEILSWPKTKYKKIEREKIREKGKGKIG